MPRFKYSCPSCQAVLRSDKRVPPEVTVDCPNCHNPFLPAVSALPELGPVTLRRTDRGNNTVLLLGLLAIGAMLLVGAGVVVAIIMTRPRQEQASGSSGDSDKVAELQKENERLKKDREFDRLLHEANKALEEKRYGDARASYEKALVIHPDDPRPSRGLDDVAAAQRSAGDSDDKDKLFAKYMKVGNDAMDKKDYASAIVAFEAAIKLKADEQAFAKLVEAKKSATADEAEKKKLADYKDQVDSGERFMKGQNYAEALSAFRKALDLQPGDDLAKNKLAQAEKRLHAETDSKKARQNYDTLVARGKRDLDDKHFKAAIDNFNQAINLMPQEPEAQQQLKNAKEQKKSAQTDFEDAMRKGNIALNNGLIDSANLYFEQAAKIMPDNGDLVIAAQKKKADLVVALEGYALAMRQGEAAMRSKMYEVAIVKYTLALSLLPADPVAAAALEKARAKELERNTELEKLLRNGKASLSTGAYQDALKAFATALAMAPGSELAAEGAKKAREGLREATFSQAVKAGDAAMAAKNYKEAVRQYQIALQQKPNDPNVALKLMTAKQNVK